MQLGENAALEDNGGPMKVTIAWDMAEFPIKAASLIEQVRDWVRNTLDRGRIHTGASDYEIQGVILEPAELYMGLIGAVVGALQVNYGIDPSITIRMSHEEAFALEQKLNRQRSALESGIEMLKATRSWFKDKRLAEIRRKLESGLN